MQTKYNLIIADTSCLILLNKIGELRLLQQLIKKGLNERQIKAITYLKEQDSIINREYKSMFNISDRTRNLNDLESKGLVKKSGQKKVLVTHLADKWQIWRINGGYS